MNTAEIVNVNGKQSVTLPDEFRFECLKGSIRQHGEAVILEPVKPDTWPPEFFEDIHIDDPAFVRPRQGELPPSPQALLVG